MSIIIPVTAIWIACTTILMVAGALAASEE